MMTHVQPPGYPLLVLQFNLFAVIQVSLCEITVLQPLAVNVYFYAVGKHFNWLLRKCCISYTVSVIITFVVDIAFTKKLRANKIGKCLLPCSLEPFISFPPAI
jgi:hypothetical protein